MEEVVKRLILRVFLKGYSSTVLCQWVKSMTYVTDLIKFERGKLYGKEIFTK